jgi:hypothetical protein
MSLSIEDKYTKSLEQLEEIIFKCINKGFSKTVQEHLEIERLLKLCKLYSKNWQKNILYLLYSKELDLYKIGITSDLYTRIRHIKNEMGIKSLGIVFSITNASYLEKKLHKKFDYLNVPIQRKSLHREWFRYDDKIINEFKTLQNG